MPRYDVILMGFPDAPRVGGSPAEAIASVFGIATDAAARMVDTVPSIVKKDVDEDDARRYRNAFAYIGAECRFRIIEPVPQDSLRLDVDSSTFGRPQLATADPAVVSGGGVAFPEEAADSGFGEDVWGNEQTQPPSVPPEDAPEAVDFEAATDDFDDWDPWSGSGIGEFAGDVAASESGTSASNLRNTGTIIDVQPDREKLLQQLAAFDNAKPGAIGPPETQESYPPSSPDRAPDDTDGREAELEVSPGAEPETVERTAAPPDDDDFDLIVDIDESALGAPEPESPERSPTYEARYEELFGLTPAEYVSTVPDELELDYTGERAAAPSSLPTTERSAAPSTASALPTTERAAAPAVVSANRTIQGMRAVELVDELVAGRAVPETTLRSADLSAVIEAIDDADSDR